MFFLNNSLLCKNHRVTGGQSTSIHAGNESVWTGIPVVTGLRFPWLPQTLWLCQMWVRGCRCACCTCLNIHGHVLLVSCRTSVLITMCSVCHLGTFLSFLNCFLFSHHLTIFPIFAQCSVSKTLFFSLSCWVSYLIDFKSLSLVAEQRVILVSSKLILCTFIKVILETISDSVISHFVAVRLQDISHPMC